MDTNLTQWDANKWWGSNFVDVAKQRNSQWMELANDWGTKNPEQDAWWNGVPNKFFYDQMGSSGVSYDPSYGGGSSYDPDSFSSSNYISGVINNWLTSDENAWLYDLSGIGYGGTQQVGKVTQDPEFGQFSQDLNVYRDIQDASNKYGVPANFLQAIIMHESSGDWIGNNAKGVVWLPERNQGILPYVGVTADAVKSWVNGDINTYVGNRRAQIDLLAFGLAKLYSTVKAQNPGYTWLNVAAMHYSGNADLNANSTPADSVQYGTTQEYVNNVSGWWKSLDAKATGNDWNAENNGAPIAGSTSTGGMGTPSSSKWTKVNQWNNQITAAIQKVQTETGVAVPGNVVKAIMQIESGGDANVGVSPAGYGGLMQTGPGSMGGPWTMQQLQDPAFAIYTGVKELALRYNDSGQMPWANVIVGYFSGHYTPNGASDGFNTDYNYQSMFNSNMNELGASGSGMFGGAGVSVAPVNISTIFGGMIPTTSQENGDTNEWTAEHKDMYIYGVGLGITNGGHPGNDYVMPYASQIFSGTAGTVIFIGPGGAYENDFGGPGRIEIKMDNGDTLIYGHMSGSDVTMGQRVKVGDKIGKSGQAGSGAHVHLELRVVDPTTPDGYRSVNPGSGIVGSGAMDGTTGGPNPYTPQGPKSWQDVMIWAAKGKSLEGMSGAVSQNKWNLILTAAAQGSSVANMMKNGRMSSIDRALSGNGVSNVSGAPLSGNQQQIVSLANRYVGVTPYVWAGHDPTGWDCSGFVSWLYKNAWGVDISTGSHYQYTTGISVPMNQLQAGDLLFYDTSGGTEFDNGNYASHVAMYIGNGQMVQAANPQAGTIISSVNDSYYTSKFIGARRYV